MLVCTHLRRLIFNRVEGLGRVRGRTTYDVKYGLCSGLGALHSRLCHQRFYRLSLRLRRWSLARYGFLLLCGVRAVFFPAVGAFCTLRASILVVIHWS